MSKYKYEIAATTREQREKYAIKAETSTLGGGTPSTYAKELAQKYVDGDMEVSEVQKAIIERYKKTWEKTYKFLWFRKQE